MAFSHHSKQYEPKVISYWNHFTRTHLQHRQPHRGGRRSVGGAAGGVEGEVMERTASVDGMLTTTSAHFKA